MKTCCDAPSRPPSMVPSQLRLRVGYLTELCSGCVAALGFSCFATCEPVSAVVILWTLVRPAAWFSRLHECVVSFVNV